MTLTFNMPDDENDRCERCGEAMACTVLYDKELCDSCFEIVDEDQRDCREARTAKLYEDAMDAVATAYEHFGVYGVVLLLGAEVAA